MKPDALQQVFSTYEFLKDSMKVTKRSINRSLHYMTTRSFLDEKKMKREKPFHR
jgi:hypothetical protein